VKEQKKPKNMNKAEQQTVMSKTTLYQQPILNFEQQAIPLLVGGISQFKLFESPLSEPQDMKRVALFSDHPMDEGRYGQ